MAVAVKALFFDVFGTLVDWRTSIAREAKAMLEPQGYTLDWLAFADAWRGEYQGAMDEVRSGRIPFCKLDVLHRRNLELILPRFRVESLSEAERHDLNLAWHRLDAWPDVPPGLHRLKRRYMAGAGLERQYFADGRSGAAQRSSLGRDPRLRDRRRLQAEAARLSRRRRGVRPAAYDCMMVAAHTNDLMAAAELGLRTAHIARPNERGPGRGEAAPECASRLRCAKSGRFGGAARRVRTSITEGNPYSLWRRRRKRLSLRRIEVAPRRRRSASPDWR